MAEQEREQLIQQAERDVPDSVDYIRSAIEALVNAGWRPPPHGDAMQGAHAVIDEAIRFNMPVDLAGPRMNQYADIWANAARMKLNDAGYLRTPGCYDPIECGHEAALGEVEPPCDHHRGVGWRPPPSGDVVEQASAVHLGRPRHD